MRDSLVPVAQRLPCGFLDDGQFVIVSGKAADGVQAGEERDRGEHDLQAIVLTVLLCVLGPLPLGDDQIAGSTDASRVIAHAPAFADYAELACSLIRRYGAAEPTVSAALLIMLRDAQALVSDPNRIQVLASHARLVLSDAEQLTQQPADLLQVRDQAALLLADGT